MSTFLERTKERAKADKQTIVLAEGEEIRSIEAAAMILKEGIANIILLGNKDVIAEKAGSLDISAATVIDPETDSHFGELADKFCESCKAKRHDAGKSA